MSFETLIITMMFIIFCNNSYNVFIHKKGKTGLECAIHVNQSHQNSVKINALNVFFQSK